MKSLKIFTFITILMFGVTSSVFASWWNPFTWNYFKKRTASVEQIQKTPTETEGQVSLQVSNKATTTSSNLENKNSLGQISSVTDNSFNNGTSSGAVIGYIFSTDVGSPRFSEVTIPVFHYDDFNQASIGSYDVYIYQDEQFVFYKKVQSRDTVTFPKGGTSKFKILGIDPAFGVCATSRGIMWNFDLIPKDSFKGSKSAITTSTTSPRCASVKGDLTMYYGNYLKPSYKSIPSGFTLTKRIGVTSDVPYGLIYEQGTGKILINVFKDSPGSMYSYDAMAGAVKDSKGQKEDFTYNNNPGVVAFGKDKNGEATYDLYYKDGADLIRIYLENSDKTKFTKDSALTMLKSFIR